MVCTIGPASAKETTLTSMIKAGMDVARQNFSHADHAYHKQLSALIRKASKNAGKLVPIIADLQGPKIRVGALPEEGIKLVQGEVIELPITYANIHKDVKRGHRVFIDDGIFQGTVVSAKKGKLKLKITNGGLVTSHKGMNFPDTTLSVQSFTKKDREDARFAIKQGIEWIALSFVTSPSQVRALKRLIKTETPAGKPLARVIVKIEKHEAITHFDEILKVADAIMVARGDLGVEIPAEEVPIRQKELIEACRLAGKPVIVATQMLDSMIRNPRPTRAEVSDVANAVIDHTDAVMLSGETASGKYPLKAVKMMDRIIKETEQSPYDDVLFCGFEETDKPASIAHTLKTLWLSNQLSLVTAIQAESDWFETILRERPEAPLLLGCESLFLARQQQLRWSCIPFVFKAGKQAGRAKRIDRFLHTHKHIKKQDTYAYVFMQQKKDPHVALVGPQS